MPQDPGGNDCYVQGIYLYDMLQAFAKKHKVMSLRVCKIYWHSAIMSTYECNLQGVSVDLTNFCGKIAEFQYISSICERNGFPWQVSSPWCSIAVLVLCFGFFLIKNRWWFQIYFICTLTWGVIQFDDHIFQMGWNHQLEKDHSFGAKNATFQGIMPFITTLDTSESYGRKDHPTFKSCGFSAPVVVEFQTIQPKALSTKIVGPRVLKRDQSPAPPDAWVSKHLQKTQLVGSKLEDDNFLLEPSIFSWFS